MVIKEEKVKLKPLELARIKVTVVGKTPFLPEPMDMSVLDLYDKKKSGQVYDKDNQSESEKAKKKYYYTNDGKKGILVRGFYKSMIKASSYLFDKSDGGMRNIKEGITLYGDIIPLKYKKETQVIHWGRTSGRNGSPRKIIRNAFHDWECELTIEYNKNQLTPEMIVNVLNYAGFYIGVGGFRKENSGNYGSFQVKI